MKIRAAVAILLLAILATSPMLIMTPLPVNAAGVNPTYITLSDAYMSDDTEWALRDGVGITNDSATIIDNIPGPGVQFNLNGLTGDKAAMSDKYMVDIPGVGEDLSGYGGYELYLKNVGTVGWNAHLFMNTGHTASNWKLDTFWGGLWVWLNPGETKLYTLNFSNAEAWNADDDPVVAWQVPGGSWTTVKRLNETTNIGFEIDPAGTGDFPVVAFGSTNPELYVTPSAVYKVPANDGDTFTVDVVIENFTDFYAFDINMTWDSDLLEFVSAEYTSHLNTLWGSGLNDWYVWPDDDIDWFKLIAMNLGTGGVSATGAYTLFTLTLRIMETCNTELSTPIHFAVANLTDSVEPFPNEITAVVTDGTYYMSGYSPTIDFVLVTDSHPWEYGKTFNVEVWIEDIDDFSPLVDYDLTIELTDPGLASYTGVIWSGYGTGPAPTYTPGPPDEIRVECTGTTPLPGLSFKLFTLTFEVDYDASPQHVWKYVTNEHMTFSIELDTSATVLGFGVSLGDLDDAIPPSPLPFDVYFIRGDLNSDGVVDLSDLHDVCYWYGLPGTSIYDLNGDLDVDIFDVVAVATHYDYGT